MYVELLKAVLTPLVAFLLQAFFKLIGVEIDPVIFNTIVAAIVVWFLSLFTFEAAMRIRAVRNFVQKK